MATSSLSSLGLGSDGALSYDTIDKLREVDEAAQLDPIDTKLTTNSTKQTDLSTITSLASTLKSATSALSDDTYYLQRTTTVSNDAVTVTADGGTNVQDFTLRVDTLAKQDIYQSTSFASATSTFTSASDTLTLSIDGKDYDFAVTSSTTITELADMINDKLDGKVTASILNTGGTNPYRLIIKSDDTGAENAITISSGNASTLTSLGYDVANNHLQTATDATFTYNGVSVTRSSNTIDDLIVGVTITLNDVQASTESTTVSIKQDWTDVKEQLTTLVTAYNDLMTNLQKATTYDSEAGTAGIFQGVSQLTNLSASIRKQLLSIDENNRSLVDYGISLNDSGSLEFDEDAFNTKIKNDPADIQDFFVGSTDYNTTTYTGTALSAGALNVTYGGLTINDTGVRFTTTAGATAADNALSLQNAINAAGISGVTASVGDNNNIILKSATGEDIIIEGSSSVLTSLGLKASTTYGHSVENKGIFTEFNALLKEYVTEDTGLLSLYSDYLSEEKDSLTTQRENTVTKLDSKYEIMAKRFAAYDSIISTLTTQFQSLSYLIAAESSSDS